MFFPLFGHILDPSVSCGLVSTIKPYFNNQSQKNLDNSPFCVCFKIFLVILSSVSKIQYVGGKNLCNFILYNKFTKKKANHSKNIDFEVVCISFLTFSVHFQIFGKKQKCLKLAFYLYLDMFLTEILHFLIDFLMHFFRILKKSSFN